MALAGRVDDATDAGVVDMEETVDNPLATAEGVQWTAHCIYRVPARIKNLNTGAYKPQTVSLGPFHHGEPELLPMERHKRRALQHVVQRAGKTVEELVAALEEVAEQLESAYMDLSDDWCGPGKRGRFLQVMVTDGCFLLELMRTAAGKHLEDYASNDPIFSPHGKLYTIPYIKSDMLRIENQLPLLVLERIVAVENGNSWVNDGQKDELVNMVLEFMSLPPAAERPGLHPLDVFRQSVLRQVLRSREAPDSSHADGSVTRSAVELYEAGIRFKESNTGILFHKGVLWMPVLVVHDDTEYMLLNMMAFECLHVGAGNDVTTYVFFMEGIVKSAKDVALLRSKRLIRNDVGPDEEVPKLFNRLTKGVVDYPNGSLHQERCKINEYLRNNVRRMLNKWWGYLVSTYFKSPWTAVSLFAATVLLVLTVVQTVCAVLSLKGKD